MANKEVKTLTVDSVTYDIKDEKSRNALTALTTRVSTAEGNISTNTNNITANANAITALNNAAVHKTGDEAISGVKTFNNNPVVKGGIELIPGTSATNGGFIDFHFAGSTADNTSRIIESASGQLQFSGTPKVGTSPAVSENSTKIATTQYINNKFKYVTALPATPDPNTFYFLPE